MAFHAPPLSSRPHASPSSSRFSFLTIFIMVSALIISFSLLRVFLSLDTLSLTSAAPHKPKPAEVDTTWHAPNSSKTNDLKWVISGPGTDEKIYDSSNTADGKYGGYNYCNMPHVRAPEYPGPPEKDMQLEYVELIHRHHKRTPYKANMFPTVGDGEWDCSDPADNKSNKTCKYPQLTHGGLVDSTQHGKDLFSVYHEKLSFLPEKYDPDTVVYRVTNNPITSQVAKAVIRGMYPSALDSIMVQKGSETTDSLEPRYPCPYADSIRNGYQGSTPAWTEHLKQSQPLFDKLDAMSGINKTDPAWHSWWDHYFDFTSTHTCDGKKLPCAAQRAGNHVPGCVTQTEFEEIMRLGQYEYSYIFRDADKSLEYATYHYGVFPSEVVGRLRKKTAGGNVKYTHNVAHDGSISSLLAFLQVDGMVWPGMGSEIVFELWSEKEGKKKRYRRSVPRRSVPGRRHEGHDEEGEMEMGEHEHGHEEEHEHKKEKEYYVRVLWGGKVMVSKSKTLSWMNKIKLSDFAAYVEGLTGVGARKVWGKCK